MDIQTPQTAVLKHPIFNSVFIVSVVTNVYGSEKTAHFTQDFKIELSVLAIG